MSELIVELYAIELEIKKKLINDEDVNALYGRLGDFYHKLQSENNYKSSKVDCGYSLFDSVEFPLDILRGSSLNAMQGNITAFDRNKINTFFLQRFNRDISNVDILSLQSMPPHAEGYAMTCSTDDHYICIPSNLKESFLSYDLLVHEFGHTVEYTEKRKNSSPDGILLFPVLSEAIAHYFQMVYMLEHSTEEERLGMLASTTDSYLFYRCMQIMGKIEPKACVFDPNKIINHDDFSIFREAYMNTPVINNFFARHKGENFYDAYLETHASRFGVLLALNFIKYKLDINELFSIKLPKGRVSLEGLICQTKIKPKVLFNFSKMNETITRFVAGKL